MAVGQPSGCRRRPTSAATAPEPRQTRAGCAPDGSRRTLRDALAAGWFVPGDLDPTTQLLLADAQTSGGLLLAVPPAGVDQVLGGLRAVGEQHATVVGELVEGVAGQVGIAGDDRAAGLRGTAR